MAFTPVDYIASYFGWNQFTPALPNFYWDVYSAEERVKKICFELDKLCNYANMLADNINIDHTLIQELQDALANIENIDEINEKVEALQTQADYIQQVLETIPDYDEFLALQEDVENLQNAVATNTEDITNRIVYPSGTNPKYGTVGQVLGTYGDGRTVWQNPVAPTDAQANTYITAWLNAHPEATTTVQDGSITGPKLSELLSKQLFNVRGTLPSAVASDDDLMFLGNGAYLVNNPSYDSWIPTALKTGMLIIMKTNAQIGADAVTYYGVAMWLPATPDTMLYYRTFYHITGSDYNWRGNWKSTLPGDNTITLSMFTEVLNKSIAMGRSNLPTSVASDYAVMCLPAGCYAISATSYRAFLPVELQNHVGSLFVYDTYPQLDATKYNSYKTVIFFDAQYKVMYARNAALYSNGTGAWVNDWSNVTYNMSEQRYNILSSASPIYRQSNGVLVSESDITLHLNDGSDVQIATATDGLASVTIGNGSNVYYAKSLSALTSSNTFFTHNTNMTIVDNYTETDMHFFLQHCACYGDSITWYDGNQYNWGKQQGDTAIGYETWLRRKLGMYVYNRGGSGEGAPQIMSRVVNATDFENIEYVILTSGANDERKNTPLGSVLNAGSTFDATTFCGSFQTAIEHILTISPSTKIILCTPIQGWIYGNGYDSSAYPDHPQSGYIQPKWANAIKEVAQVYSLPVCDWYAESGLNLLTRNLYYNDPEPPENTLYSLHPDDAGFKRMSEILISTFEKIRNL